MSGFADNSLDQFMAAWPGVSAASASGHPQHTLAVSQNSPAPVRRMRGRGPHAINFDQSPWQGGGRLGMDSARRDRTVSDFYPGSMGPNRIHSLDARLTRERARYLVDANAHAYAAIDAFVCNCLQTGIAPKPIGSSLPRRREVIDTWNEWGGLTAVAGSEADLTGQQTIDELAELWLREYLVAGGCLLHFVEPADAGRTVPLAIELLPEERFADDADTATGKNNKTFSVYRGVEFDPATGRHVAYWVRRFDGVDQATYDPEPIRLPAADCHYGYHKTRSGQLRGVSALRAAVLTLWRLGVYTDHEMIASQMKSAFAYFLETPPGEEELGFDDFGGAEPGTDAFGNAIAIHEGGQVVYGRTGQKLSGVGPNTPQSSQDWLTHIERTVGMAVGLSRIALTRDAGEASFSSARMAGNEDRQRYRRIQKVVINHFLNPIYREFYRAAVRAGRDGLPSPSQFMAAPNEFLKVTFRAPGWESVNPIDDAKAAEVLVGLGVTSRDEIRSRLSGEGDLDETFDQLEREETIAQQKNIPIHGAQAGGSQDAAGAGADSPRSPSSSPRRAAGRPANGGGR